MKSLIFLSTFSLSALSLINAQMQPPESCPPGTIYDSNYFACLPCNPGTYSPGGTPATSVTTCKPCPNGFYSLEGAGQCSPCEPGTFAAPHNHLLYPICYKCPKGTYQPYYNASVPQRWQSYQVCQPCPNGLYADTPGSVSCDGILPYGVMHTISLSIFSPKRIGDTSVLGFGNANMSCFAGWHCGTGTDRYKCPPGSYAPQGSSECTLCPAGSYSTTEGSASCTPACRNLYIDTVGANSTTACQSCPGDHRVLDIGMGSGNIFGLETPFLTSKDCRKHCPNLGTVFDGNNSCVHCTNNTAAIYTYYNPNFQYPGSLAQNLNSYQGVQTWNATCEASCPPGTFFASYSAFGVPFSPWCDICYGGNIYCPGGPIDYATNSPSYQTCPSGLQANIGAKSIADCYPPCSVGACVHDGSSVCEFRKSGYSYTVDGGRRTCSPCPIGTGTSVIPGTSACSPAPIGRCWVNITNSTWGNCPPNHYTPIADVQPYGPTIVSAYVPPLTCGPDEVPFSDNTRCVPKNCPPGTTFDVNQGICTKYDTYDDTRVCYLDMINSYISKCPGVNGTNILQIMATSCFGSTDIPSSDGSTCISESCEPGFYQDTTGRMRGTNIINGTRCRPCPNYDHLYCPGGTTMPNICSMNFTDSYGGQQGIVTPNRTNCICPPGAEPKQYTNKCFYRVTSCPIGEYVDTIQNMCKPCPNNFICPDGVQLILCPFGTISATNKTVCIPGSNNNNNNVNCAGAPPTCSSGQSLTCNGNTWQCMTFSCTGDAGACNGRTSCTGVNVPFTCTTFSSCAPGEYLEYTSPSLDTVCRTPPSGNTSCSAGQYLTVTGTSASNLALSCSPCPSGYTCPGGIGALALSNTYLTFPFTGSSCPQPERPIITEIAAGAPPKGKCGKLVFPPNMPSAVLSCAPGTVRIFGTLNCYPCPVGATQCLGEFRTFSDSGGGNVAPSASSTPSQTPTPSTTPSAAPPSQQDILIPYLISSPDVCASTGVADKFLDPSTGIAINLRYSMASSLGYNGSAAFVSGLVVCDNTYIPVAKDAAINTVSADTLYNTTETRRRRLYDMLNTLSLPIDGTTVVVELGVSVPAILAPALTQLMVAMITNQSTADIQAYANNITAIMSSPEYLAMYPAQPGPNVAVSIPSSLVTVISLAANSGNAPTFTASLATVATAAVTPLLTSLNISVSGANISVAVYGNGIRTGSITTFSNNYNGGASAPSGSDSSGSNGALGALVLIPIAAIVIFFIIWYRRRKDEEKKATGTRSKSIDDNFTDVSGMNGSIPDKKFEVTNPSSNLLVRRTVVEVKSHADENNATTNV